MTEAAKTHKISITRALTLLKGLTEKIDTAIVGGVFVSAAVGEKNRSEVAIKDLAARVQGSHDKVTALLANRNAIKAAIVNSNAATKITFRGKEITVAEAIEQRTSSKAVLSKYLLTMVSQLAAANNLVERSEAAVRDAVNRAEQTIYGRESTVSNSEREEEMNLVRDAQRRMHGGQLVDPAGLQKKIDEVREHITDLDNELDALLSESNAKTLIDAPI